MALGTDHFTATDLDKYIPEKWGARINEFYRSQLHLASFFTDRSDELMDGGDTVYTPNLTQMSASDKTVGSQVTLSSPTETTQTLVVDTHKHVAFVIEDVIAAKVKRSYSVQERYMKNAAYTVAKTLETALAALFAGFSTSVGTTNTAITAAVIRQAISKYSATNNAPLSEAAFFLHGKTIWEEIMAIDVFATAYNTANASNPILKGQVSRVYNVPVIECNNLATANAGVDYVGALANPDAIHWASLNLTGGTDSMSVRLQASYVHEYLGTLVTADMAFGVIENRDAGGVQIISKVA